MIHTNMCLEVGLEGREQIRPHEAHSDRGRGLIQRSAMAISLHSLIKGRHVVKKSS